MSEFKIRVVAATLDKTQLTLYKEDATTYIIKQGDARLQPIVEKITPLLAAGQVVEVSMPAQENVYQDYQEKSGGLVRFFRVAKSKVANLFAAKNAEVKVQAVSGVMGAHKLTAPVRQETAAPVSSPISSIFVTPQEPIQQPPLPVSAPTPAAVPEAAPKILNVVQEIIKHAKPVETPGFADLNDGSNETIVAVVGDQAVPAVEQITSQIKHSVTKGSTKAMDAFMARAAKVASERWHSVDDLLKFLQRGDLPIADDGSIVIYKVLRHKKDKPGYYVDCHTGRVEQRIGSYVCMDPRLVDHNRTVECSNGLHVARRAYIHGFSGDVVVLAKVAPEDVIAVPEHDANKMRVCGYHILFELSKEDHEKLRRNTAFTDTDEAKQLLGAALSGNHPPKIEEVRITQHLGHGVQVKSLIQTEEPAFTKTPAPAPAPVALDPAVKAEALPEAEVKKQYLSAAPVEPKAVAQKVVAVKAETNAEKARKLFDAFSKAKSQDKAAEAAQAIFYFKKQAKKGWGALGITDAEVEKLTNALPRV